ncbi:unnamed protein product [Trichobilharzia regenti]|nr:unnamed protein product [Trichobilharzia regenti]
MSYRTQFAEIDLGNLLVEDKCPLNDYTEGKLPTEKSDSITVSLIPTTKELTKWDRFARLKGIQNRKKSRKVWDPVSQSWKPRWGKDRIDDLKDKWVLEVPDNAGKRKC